MNRSRAGGYGEEYAGRPGPEGYDAGYDADRYQDRADYHDFDAAFGDDYDDGAAASYGRDYAPYGAGPEAAYEPGYEQAGYEQPGYEQGGHEQAGPGPGGEGAGRRGRRGVRAREEAYETAYADEYAAYSGDSGFGGDAGYDAAEGYDEQDGYEQDAYDGDAYDDGYDVDGDDAGYDEDAEDAEPELSNRIFTIPNLISVARLAGVPLFLGLILSPYYGGPKYDVWALVVLALSGFSDWLDGKLARRWNQQTKFGAMLDPLADRLYILSTLVGFTMRGIIPLWLPIVLIGRDVAMLFLITPKLRKAGYGVALPVHFLGKAATFNLLYAFPLLLLGQIGEDHKQLMDIGNIFGWAFVGWGTGLYLLAGGMYFIQAQQLTRTVRGSDSR